MDELKAGKPTMWILLFVALALVFFLELILGSVSIPVGQVFRVLLGLEPGKASWKTIILFFRLPRAITAILAGAGLAVSGLGWMPDPASVPLRPPTGAAN